MKKPAMSDPMTRQIGTHDCRPIWMIMQDFEDYANWMKSGRRYRR